jgi:ketosteroid isomerase-like protein
MGILFIMQTHFKMVAKIIFIFCLALFLISCAAKTDEELIIELMGDVGEFAEKKDIESIMMMLADDYTDFQKRDKSRTRDMIKQYFDQYRGIVIHVLSTQIDEMNPPEASIRTDIAMSSGVAKVLRKAIRFSTDNYRLKLRLIKRDGRWLITYAEWRYVSLDELFPESLSILQKLFQ